MVMFLGSSLGLVYICEEKSKNLQKSTENKLFLNKNRFCTKEIVHVLHGPESVTDSLNFDQIQDVRLELGKKQKDATFTNDTNKIKKKYSIDELNNIKTIKEIENIKKIESMKDIDLHQVKINEHHLSNGELKIREIYSENYSDNDSDNDQIHKVKFEKNEINTKVEKNYYNNIVHTKNISKIYIRQPINNDNKQKIPQSILSTLPPEIFSHILSFLSVRHLLVCQSVCKYWYKIIQTDTVWKMLYKLNWLHNDCISFNSDTGIDPNSNLDIINTNNNLNLMTPHYKCKSVYTKCKCITSLCKVQHFVDKFQRRMIKQHLNFSQEFILVPWKLLYKTRLKIEMRRERGLASSKPLVGHSDSVYCLQFDNQKIITGSRDQSIRIWSADTGELLHTLNSRTLKSIFHTGSILSLQYDSKVMITGSSDNSCIIWCLKSLSNTSNQSNNIYSTFIPLFKLTHHSSSVLSVTMDNNYFVSASLDGTIKVWLRSSLFENPTFSSSTPSSSKYVLHTLNGHNNAPVNSVHLKNSIIASGGGTVVNLWDSHSGKLIRLLKGHTRNVAAVQLNEEATICVSGGKDHMIRIWNTKTGNCTCTINNAHSSLIRSLTISLHFIFSGSYDESVKIWDITTGKLVLPLEGWYGARVTCVKASLRRVVVSSLGHKPIVHDFGYNLPRKLLEALEV